MPEAKKYFNYKLVHWFSTNTCIQKLCFRFEGRWAAVNYLDSTHCCSSERSSDGLPKRLWLQWKGKEERGRRRKKKKQTNKQKEIVAMKRRNYNMLPAGIEMNNN